MREVMTDQEIFDSNFNGHEILSHFKDEVVEIIEFGKINSCVGWMKYIINGKFLMVLGDYGDAIYFWGGKGVLDFQWLSGLNLDYFASKCTASESGVGYKCWNPDKARDMVEWYLIWDKLEESWDGETKLDPYTNSFKLGNKPDHLSDEEYKIEVKLFQEKIKNLKYTVDTDGAFDSINNEFEWNEWLGTYGEDYLGSDWWEFGNIGIDINFRCNLHLHGIKLIAEKLKEKSNGES